MKFWTLWPAEKVPIKWSARLDQTAKIMIGPSEVHLKKFARVVQTALTTIGIALNQSAAPSR